MSSVLASLAPKYATKKSLGLAIATLTLGMSFQSKADEPILEEIIITSQKRPESLQDVPISVAAITGDKIVNMGIENLEDLTTFVPNLHFTETGIGTQLRIRGIGSDNSQGFEQSVGVYVDGIYHGRAQLFRAPIFDMERIEVMRGPQSTLFGKNSLSGALDLITAKPTDEFEGNIFGSHETEFGTNELSGVVSGPLSQTLNGRIAVRSYDDPGFMTNRFKNTTEANQEEFTIRGSLDWQTTDNLSALLIVEHDTFDVQGRASETTQDVPTAPSAPSFYQVLANPAFNDGVNPGPTYDPNLDFIRDTNSPEFSDNTIDTQTLRLDYQWNEFTITSLTGHLTFDYLENCDCDFTPANIFDLDLAEDYKQISQEIRITSPTNGAIEWVAGVFYQSYDQTFSDDFNIQTNSILPPVLIAGHVASVNANPAIADGDKAAAIAQGRAAIMTLAGAGISRDFEQSSDSWAIFGDITWNVTSDFNVKLGARFTEEKKEATKQLNVVDINNNHTPLTGALGATAATLFFSRFAVDTEELAILPDAVRAGMGAPSGHSLSGSRDESAFTPSLTLSYYPNEEILAYAKVSKGFKAGGFDPRSNNVGNFEFEEEKVLATEIGAKMGLAQGRGELNIALFKMDYDDLQVSQFDGKIGFNVGNAKDTRVQGLELDSRWQFSEKLSSGFGFTYLDFEYLDFENGNCHYPTPAPTSDGPAFCDYTGERGVYTPEYTVNGSLDYRQPIYGNMTLVSSIDAQWVDEQEVHVNLDPAGTTDAFTLLSMRIAVETEQWQVALLGQNLLDEEIITYSGNTPLAETIAKSNTHYSFVRRPRTVALTGRINF